MSGFNLIRKYINKDVLTDMSNTFLYYNYLVDITLLGAYIDYVSVPFMNGRNSNNEILYKYLYIQQVVGFT